MSREVVYYGERGILNSIVLDTQGDIAKQKQFLRTIVLGDKSKLEWVDDVEMFKYFVEPCFDQFGKVDLIIESDIIHYNISIELSKVDSISIPNKAYDIEK